MCTYCSIENRLNKESSLILAYQLLILSTRFSTACIINIVVVIAIAIVIIA